MKKVVVKVTLEEDPKKKQKALKSVAGMEGVMHASMNTNDGVITVVGETDPVAITRKLRKFGFSDLVSVGPAKDKETTHPDPGSVPFSELPIVYRAWPAGYSYYDEQSGSVSPCTII